MVLTLECATYFPHTVDSLYVEHPLSRTSFYLELKSQSLCVGCNLFYSLYLELSLSRTNSLVPYEFEIVWVVFRGRFSILIDLNPILAKLCNLKCNLRKLGGNFPHPMEFLCSLIFENFSSKDVKYANIYYIFKVF